MSLGFLDYIGPFGTPSIGDVCYVLLVAFPPEGFVMALEAHSTADFPEIMDQVNERVKSHGHNLSLIHI